MLWFIKVESEREKENSKLMNELYKRFSIGVSNQVVICDLQEGCFDDMMRKGNIQAID